MSIISIISFFKMVPVYSMANPADEFWEGFNEFKTDG